MLNRRTALSVAGSLAITGLAGCGASGGFGGIGSDTENQRQEIVTTYDEALTARNDATETRDTGVNLFNTEEYNEAINRFESAQSSYEAAEAGFAETAELATELAEEEAASICEVARDEARLQIEATESALAAATAAEEGADASTINGHIEAFRDVEAQANALTVEDTEVLAEVLGVQ